MRPATREATTAVFGADLVRHPRDPAAMLKRAGEFAFPSFKRRLAEALKN